MNYKGWAVFCDCDFIFLNDIAKIIENLDESKAIYCVKHDYTPKEKHKMDGQQQTIYPRKNWSSLIIYNCSKLKNLTKEYLDNASPSDLHELKWADKIGEIPRSYNHLVGVYKPHNKIKALHYTNGGPWFDKYKDAELSEEWWSIYKNL